MAACTVNDLRKNYVVVYEIDGEYDRIGEAVDEHFDEYYCGNCDEYFEYGSYAKEHIDEQQAS